MTSIGVASFLACESLQEIYIPDGVTDIGKCAFDGCKSLREISIPSSVTSIGDDAFSDCLEIRISKGSRKHFEQLLPYDKDRLVEV